MKMTSRKSRNKRKDSKDTAIEGRDGELTSDEGYA
jgi:hypothetical protein